MNQLASVTAVVAGLVAILMVADGWAASSDLHDELQVILNEEALTGLAWSLLDDTGKVSPGTLGFRDAESESEFTLDTRFHVGSVTKSLLATGVLRMATQGLVALDAPVSDYLPDLQFVNPWRGSSNVTVRHLLDHTSGLNDAHLWQLFSERPDPDSPLVAAFPDPEIQLRIRSEPGSRFSYSNMGYTLLGMVIEAIAGQRYETFLDQALLQPLGMIDSTFAFTTQEGPGVDPSLAWGHVDDGSRVAAKAVFLRPAAQFTTTTSDLMRFAEFLLSDGQVDGRSFISRDLMRSRGRPVATEAAQNQLSAGYALGLGRRDRHGVVGFCHGGNIIGFVAMLCVFPDDRKAFVYSVNTDSETADYGRIDNALIKALEVKAALQPPSVEPAASIKEWYGRYIFSPNRFQTFEYLDTVFGSIEITPDGDLLRLTSMQNDPRGFRPVGPLIYSAADRTTASHVFLRGNHGEYLISDGFNTYEKVPDFYLRAHWGSVFLGLAGLGWLWAAGVVSLMRDRLKMLRKPEAPTFLAMMALFIPLPFFLNQSYMALGDFTLASALLAMVTALLPIGALWTLIRAGNRWQKSKIDLIHGVAALFVIQWCVVLAVAKMLPLRLWV